MQTNVWLRNLFLGTPPRSGAPGARRGHIQTMRTWLSREPLNHPLPVSALPATISPAADTCSFTFVATTSFSSTKKGGSQLLVDIGCSSHMVDPEVIPNERPAPSRAPGASTTDNCSRTRIARVVSNRSGEAHDRCRNTAGTQREVYMSVMLVRGLGRILLSSSAAMANGVETIVSAVPALRAKGENVSFGAGNNLYSLDAIIPEPPGEYANVRETSSVMLWHRRLALYQRSTC